MNLRGSDIVPISEARARLTELAQGVVDGASEKILTQNGACSFGHIAGGLMARPPHARLGAAPDFATPLAQAHAFFAVQDADTTHPRCNQLNAELRDMKRVLSGSPVSARSDRFLNSRSSQAKTRTAQIVQLAAQAGLPFLREDAVAQHVALDAHAEADVVWLALKHHRQLAYSPIR